MNPTLIEMTTKFLADQGYDGLCSEGGRCACLLDDLMPCGDPGSSCEAGMRVDGCSEDCGEGCAWHVVAREPGPRPTQQVELSEPSGITGELEES